MSKITVIITAYKEASSIERCLKYICDSELSGYNESIDVIQISPDIDTLKSGKNYISNLKNPKINYIQIKDPNNGKPHALNMGLKLVKTDIVILTDGDVFFEENSLAKLVSSFNKNNLDAACGKVNSLNRSNYFMGYLSHLMVEAAHHKRLIKLSNIGSGIGTKFIEKSEFFPLSGYMIIFNKTKLDGTLGESFVFPSDCLVEDAYISYVMFNYGLKLGYIPEANVKVKFPTHYKDYMLQKKRSTGGYIQLWKYGVVKNNTKSRSFWHELRYFWFPIKYLLRNSHGVTSLLKNLYWTILFYPLRLWLWFQIWWERKFNEKEFEKTWVRIESTK